MAKKYPCGLFFMIIFFRFCGLFADDNQPLTLEPIVISKNKIHFSSYHNLSAQTLKTLPFASFIEGLNFFNLDLQSRSPNSGIQTDFSLRASGFQGVLLLLNGQRLNDPQTAHHNSDLPLINEDIERIEILPGVSSSLFGPDAMGGAINFILKKPQTNQQVLELSGGQYDTHAAMFSLSRKRENLAVRLSLENKESAGFKEDTDFKKFTSTLNFLLDIPDGDLHIFLGYQEKEFGAYDFYTPASNYLSQEWTKTYLLDTGLNLEKEEVLIKPNFLWRRHEDKFLLDKTLRRSRYLNHHSTDMFTPSLYFKKEIPILGKVGWGLEYGKECINSTNLGKYQRNHKSIFIDESIDLNKSLSLGLSFRFDVFDGFYNIYTGSTNLRYGASERHSIQLGVSRSIRIPSFTELYYNDPTTLGNRELSQEKSLNYQLGYTYQNTGVSLGMIFFLRQEKDLIDWIKRNPNQTHWQAENISKAEVSGIENNLSLEIKPYLKLNINYTYTNKHSDTQGYLFKYGPNYARHLFNNFWEFNFPFGVQVLNLSYKKKAGRGGWFLLNISLSYKTTKYSSIFLRATNVLGKKYQEIAGISQPGRWLEAGFRLEW
ncbi:MAG: TonB-dependent receptor [Candidatus Omnitrophica bacterium]|nr:TonB-dependent receptor [Candidatus Omnitrophota bacterium]